MGEVVTLDVGGTLFKTTLTTLRKSPVLSAMFDPNSERAPALADESGAYYIDRNPKAFPAILNYLRSGRLGEYAEGVSGEELMDEAEYFGLNELVDEMRQDALDRDSKELIIVFHTKKRPRKGPEETM